MALTRAHSLHPNGLPPKQERHFTPYDSWHVPQRLVSGWGMGRVAGQMQQPSRRWGQVGGRGGDIRESSTHDGRGRRVDGLRRSASPDGSPANEQQEVNVQPKSSLQLPQARYRLVPPTT